MAYFPLPILEPLPKLYYSKGEVNNLWIDPYKDVFHYEEFKDELLRRIPAVHGDGPFDFMDDNGNLFMAHEDIQTLGAPLNLTWTVRKCLGCRRKQRQRGGPKETMDNIPRRSSGHLVVKTLYNWCELYPGCRPLVRDDDLHSRYPTTEESVLSELENHYGGAVGVEASGK